MKLIAIELQDAGIKFTEVRASTRLVNGRTTVQEFVALTDDDLAKFAIWAAHNDVDFDNARVATAAEIKASEEAC